MKVLDIEKIKEIVKNNAKQPSKRLKTSTMRAKKILKVLQRDNFKCCDCGALEKLTIHHTNGRAFAKHDNHQKYRLSACVTLCKKCHEEKHQRKKYD